MYVEEADDSGLRRGWLYQQSYSKEIDFFIPFRIQDDTAKARRKRRRCTFYVLRVADDAADKGAA